MGTPTTSGKKRLLSILLVVFLLFALIVGRLAWMQIIWAPNYQKKASGQWVRSTSVDAARGKILDAAGNTLALSSTAYKLVLWPKLTSEGDRSRVAGELSALLEAEYPRLTYDYIYERVSDTGKSEIQLARQLDKETADAINALKLGTGVGVVTDVKRYYPNSELLSQVIGYTSSDGNGQDGLELHYNKYLAGEKGKVMIERDRQGNPLPYGDYEYIEPIDGCDMVLTVDATVQVYLEKALEEALAVNNAKTAQGIIMNAKTGEILAVSTQPDYDPNDPPRDDIAALSALSRNRIVADAYEPGSTFKIVTLAAGLDSGVIGEGYSCYCPGYKIVNGQRIKCWRSSGHGAQNLTQCAENSCNTAFMDIALSMGTDALYDYIYSFGFGSQTGVGLGSESAGIVTDKKYIRETDLARIGFGQSIAMTPLQLATAVCAAVNGGELMQPYMVESIATADGEIIIDNEPTVVRRVISEETSATVREILESVVANGSGKNAQIPGYRIGGKTGTAQKYEDGKIADGKLIASFIGIAPINDPELVCLILVDEPQVGTIFGSTVAAPFVKDVLSDALRYYGFRPEGSAESVTIPDLSGLTVEEANAKLVALGLTAVYQDAPTDLVTAFVPQTGAQVAVGSQVLLYTEHTSEQSMIDTVKVPDLTDKTRLQAHDILAALGLEMIIEDEFTGGKVVYQSIAAGEEVPVGTRIVLEFAFETTE